MSPDQRNAAVGVGTTTSNLRRLWTSITLLLVLAIFMEAVFAGAFLSGFGWARQAHAANAVIVAASTAVAGLVAMITLRRIPHGARLGLILLALAALIVLQIAAGKQSADGANLMWVHVPLGVALAGFAALAAAGARRLGET